MQALQTDVENVQDEKSNVDEAIDALDQLETESTVQVPIGGGAYLRATIQDIDEVIVDLGADYAAELEEDDAVSALESKKENLDERVSELNSEIAELQTEQEELEQQAQQLQQQAMQQQLQGLGGQGEGQGQQDDE
nr:prefoldin subunit alpha [Natrarchaeobaculum aegyptiacum]